MSYVLNHKKRESMLSRCCLLYTSISRVSLIGSCKNQRSLFNLLFLMRFIFLLKDNIFFQNTDRRCLDVYKRQGEIVINLPVSDFLIIFSVVLYKRHNIIQRISEKDTDFMRKMCIRDRYYRIPYDASMRQSGHPYSDTAF